MNRLVVLAIVASVAPGAAQAQGMLLPTDLGLRPLPLKYQRVAAEITDGAAETRVEQVFVNETPRPLEATYVFPLPKGAALSDFALWINGQKTKGEMLEKQKATEIYEGIVRRLQDPGLLEYLGNDLFRARVFPVPANGEQKIEIKFSQVLDYQSALYRYRYPLGATARSLPAGWIPTPSGFRCPPNARCVAPAPPQGGTLIRQDFTFSAKIASKVPLKSVYSPTHAVQVARKGDHAAVVGLEQGAGAALHDLDLYYAVSEKDIGLSLLAWRESDEPGYFLMLVSPKQEFQKGEIIGKRVTLVLDTSGSMAGEKMRNGKNALKYCLSRFSSDDQFNVIRFSTDVEALFPKPQPASGENVKRALTFVDGMEALGGTAIDEAMARALADAGEKADRRAPHLVIFITDGEPTVGETDEDRIVTNARTSNKTQSRVFTFGVGHEINARLLDKLAGDGGGTSEYVRGGKDFEAKVGGFYDKLAHPVLADVSLDLGDIGAYDVYPRKLPDLFKGTQLTILGRYRGPGDAKVRLAGYVNGEGKGFDYGTTFPKEMKSADFIPRLWAVRKVGYVLDEIRLKGERPELKDEVVALGKRFGIVTPYTSYLVVEDERQRTPSSRRSQPPPSRGWSPWAAARPASEPPAGPAPASPPAAASRGYGGSPLAERKALDTASGEAGIAVARETRAMKEEEQAAVGGGVRAAGGRTYIFRGAGWVDTQIAEAAPKTLTVKYLSEAYFALVKARPELKAALALGDRVTVVVAKGKAVAVVPDAGEEKADAVAAFLKSSAP